MARSAKCRARHVRSQFHCSLYCSSTLHEKDFVLNIHTQSSPPSSLHLVVLPILHSRYHIVVKRSPLPTRFRAPTTGTRSSALELPLKSFEARITSSSAPPFGQTSNPPPSDSRLIRSSQGPDCPDRLKSGKSFRQACRIEVSVEDQLTFFSPTTPVCSCASSARP